MSLPDLPPVLYVDVSQPGVQLDVTAPVVELDPSGTPVLLSLQPGPAGPAGPAGDGGFSYVQSTPSSVWLISNTLGRYPAAVTLIVDGQIAYSDTAFSGPDGYNTITITFATPTVGRAEVI